MFDWNGSRMLPVSPLTHVVRKKLIAFQGVLLLL
jgi:hypothetical protein